MAEPIATISYNDLLLPPPSANGGDESSSSVLDAIGLAFGGSDSSLGILAVTGVPGFSELRRHLLPMARALAELPPEELEKVTVGSAGYQVGWSHGKEKVEGDKFDTSKGSFYANPLTDDLLESVLDRRRMHRDWPDRGERAEEEEVVTGYDEGVSEAELTLVARANPAFFAPNVWPFDSMPELEGTVKEMGRLICEVGRLVARQCDEYVVRKCPGHSRGKLESVLTDSLCCKARLLHYFAVTNQPNNSITDDDKKNDVDFSDWCGWHNDHGSLTGLVPAMYLNENGKPLEKCPDPSAGLYIKSRSGRLTHAVFPADALAFQVGETTQVHTGGVLQATPHAVRGCRTSSRDGGGYVTREAFAVFMEPEYHGAMSIPEGRTLEDTQRCDAEQHLPTSVRTLRSRWKPGMNFGEFSDATFAAFH